jgi:hypothetical protein
MDATEWLKAACFGAQEEVLHINRKIRDKLLKRARKQGLTDEAEAIKLIEAWKRAARKTKRLHHGHGRHKGH